MERIRRMRLKKALFTIAFISLFIASLLSVFSFWVCLQSGAKVSSHSVEIRMHSGALDVTESEAAGLSSREIITGGIFSVLQIILPIVFFVTAMLVTASLFYRLKLKEPLEILGNGAARIMENDLDFTIAVRADDELGQLCAAFEAMRQSLLKNNRELWRQTEERKRLNAAFSHDLRNPLTVLKGSVKMAKQCCEKPEDNMISERPAEETATGRDTSTAGPAGGSVTEKNAADEAAGNRISEKENRRRDSTEAGILMENLIRIETYTQRIERYVETMSKVEKLEEITVEKVPVNWGTLTGELEKAMRFVVSDGGRQLSFKSAGDGETILLDKNILLQIAENLVSNAVRYAQRQVSVSLTLDEDALSLEVADDGPGFPAELLKNGVRPFQKGNEDSGHFGMGLYICDLLSRKHGGSLEMRNVRSGASVRAVLKEIYVTVQTGHGAVMNIPIGGSADNV